MDATIHAALDHSQTVDITTTGRRTGEPRRIEIVFHNIDGRIVISGMPQPAGRGLDLQPRGRSARSRSISRAPGARGSRRARPAWSPTPRSAGALLVDVARTWNRTDVDLMVRASPLIEVDIPGYRVAVPELSRDARRPSRLRAWRALFGLEQGPEPLERGRQLGVDPTLGLAGDEPEQGRRRQVDLERYRGRLRADGIQRACAPRRSAARPSPRSPAPTASAAGGRSPRIPHPRRPRTA